MAPRNYILFIILLIASCKKIEVEECSDLQNLYTFSNYPIGVALDINQLPYNAQYTNIATNQFNSVTPGNIFKSYYLHPSENHFDWKKADQLVQFCESNNQRLHGHTLIWHNQLPYWMEQFQGSPSEWELLFKEHIQTICKHFKGKVTSWDVVNEAFNENGTLRNTIWKQKIGPTYIEKAFRYAHKADPEALLFYNDYNVALNETKRKAILDLCNNLRLRGVPIDGIGMQMHISTLFPDNKQIAAALKDISNNDFKIHLSEVDISLNPLSLDIEPSKELFDRQANKLASVVLLYNDIPTKYQYGITFWGISDKDSWIPVHFNREDYPLLFDVNYDPKPAYCKLKETL